jgi:hypothetical protein
MKVIWYTPSLLLAAAGAFFGSIWCFKVSHSELLWLLGTFTISICCAFAGIGIANAAGAKIDQERGALAAFFIGVFCAIVMLLWFSLSFVYDPL